MTAASSHLRDDALTIFLFHGVIASAQAGIRNYTRKHLPLDDFVEVIADLQRHGTSVSLLDATAGADVLGPQPARAFAITFDDGFQNNFTHAAPVLADMKVPATFYVTTGFVDENGSSWIDRIEFAVEESAVVELDHAGLGLKGRWQTDEEKRSLLELVRFTVKSNRNLDPERIVGRYLGADRCSSVRAGCRTGSEDDLGAGAGAG